MVYNHLHLPPELPNQPYMDLSGILQSAHVSPKRQAKPVGAKDVDAKAMAFVCTGVETAMGWVMMKQAKYHRKLDGGFNPPH